IRSEKPSQTASGARKTTIASSVVSPEACTALPAVSARSSATSASGPPIEATTAPRNTELRTPLPEDAVLTKSSLRPPRRPGLRLRLSGKQTGVEHRFHDNRARGDRARRERERRSRGREPS